MRQNHLRALQNWNTRQKSILSQYDQPPAIRPPKRVGQSILMEAVSRFSNKVTTLESSKYASDYVTQSSTE